jgi:hypothetical protein
MKLKFRHSLLTTNTLHHGSTALYSIILYLYVLYVDAYITLSMGSIASRSHPV